jgi:hypothetical protein
VLGDSQGVLVVDAYTGYNTVLGVNGRVRAACMAHVRHPYTYLADVLVRVQSHPAARIDELRPDRRAALAAN